MRSATALFRWSTAALAALALIALASAPAIAATAPLDPRVERRLLNMANSGQESALAGLPGMTPEAAAKVIAHRKGGRRFSTVGEFRAVSGLTDDQFAKLTAHLAFRPVQKDEALKAGDEFGVLPDPSRAAQLGKAVGARRGLAKASKAGAPGEGTEGTERPEGAGPLSLEVVPNYFSVLPGYDLSGVPDEKLQIFLDRVNSEICGCGCGHTLAFCLVNHPDCPTAPPRVRKIYTEIVGEAPKAPAPSEPGKP